MPKRSSKKQLDETEQAQTPAEQPKPEPEVASEADAAPPEKNAAAVALGRLGGKKGGPARAKKLTKEQRAEIARKAAEARWLKRQE